MMHHSVHVQTIHIRYSIKCLIEHLMDQVEQIPHQWLCVGMRVNICEDSWGDICLDMHVDVNVDMCVDMCVDMYVYPCSF